MAGNSHGRRQKRPPRLGDAVANGVVWAADKIGMTRVGAGVTVTGALLMGKNEEAAASMHGSNMEQRITAQLREVDRRGYLGPPDQPFYNVASSRSQGYPPAPGSSRGSQYDNYNDNYNEPLRGRTRSRDYYDNTEHDYNDDRRARSASSRRSFSAGGNTYNPSNDGRPYSPIASPARQRNNSQGSQSQYPNRQYRLTPRQMVEYAEDLNRSAGSSNGTLRR